MSPDPRQRDLVKCEDMRIHAKRAVDYVGSRSLEDFMADDMVQAAVVRCVEVIGEAARLVSEDTRARTPGIPWPLIVGMRHILAHDYAAVNLDKVHAVVTEHLPALLEELDTAIAVLERQTGWTEDQKSN